MKCAVCGYENPDDAAVCLNCGSDVPKEKMGHAIDDISGEATILIGAPPRGSSPETPKQPPPPPPAPPSPPPAPPKAAAPPPPPPPQRPAPQAPPPPQQHMGAPPPPRPMTPAGGPPPPPPMQGGMGAQNFGSAPAPTNVLAIVSLCLGIPGVLIFCCWFLALPLGIGAAVTGYLGRQQIQQRGEKGDGLAIAGMICGAAAILLAIVWFIIAQVVGAGASSGLEEMLQQMQQNQ